MEDNNQSQEVGDYLIKKIIGQGTFGKVKLAKHIPSGELVAIKILEKSKLIDPDDIARVNREIKMIQNFNHPNVVLVTEIFESQDHYFIAMEYCQNGELFNYIVKNRRLNDEEASFFYYQLIEGIDYIHKQHIVHRDLKPENLLLTSNYILKIIDFGLSNYFQDDRHLLSTPCGSPCYASPEMVSGEKYNGFKIDIWSTGIILYAMLCGYLPFEDKNNEVLFRKIIECKLELPSALSRESKDLMRRILVTDPKKRISIEEIKKHPFYLKGKYLFKTQYGLIDDIGGFDEDLEEIIGDGEGYNYKLGDDKEEIYNRKQRIKGRDEESKEESKDCDINVDINGSNGMINDNDLEGLVYRPIMTENLDNRKLYNLSIFSEDDEDSLKEKNKKKYKDKENCKNNAYVCNNIDEGIRNTKEGVCNNNKKNTNGSIDISLYNNNNNVSHNINNMTMNKNNNNKNGSINITSNNNTVNSHNIIPPLSSKIKNRKKENFSNNINQIKTCHIKKKNIKNDDKFNTPSHKCEKTVNTSNYKKGNISISKINENDDYLKKNIDNESKNKKIEDVHLKSLIEFKLNCKKTNLTIENNNNNQFKEISFDYFKNNKSIQKNKANNLNNFKKLIGNKHKDSNSRKKLIKNIIKNTKFDTNINLNLNNNYINSNINTSTNNNNVNNSNNYSKMVFNTERNIKIKNKILSGLKKNTYSKNINIYNNIRTKENKNLFCLHKSTEKNNQNINMNKYILQTEPSFKKIQSRIEPTKVIKYKRNYSSGISKNQNSKKLNNNYNEILKSIQQNNINSTTNNINSKETSVKKSLIRTLNKSIKPQSKDKNKVPTKKNKIISNLNIPNNKKTSKNKSSIEYKYFQTESSTINNTNTNSIINNSNNRNNCSCFHNVNNITINNNTNYTINTCNNYLLSEYYNNSKNLPGYKNNNYYTNNGNSELISGNNGVQKQKINNSRLIKKINNDEHLVNRTINSKRKISNEFKSNTHYNSIRINNLGSKNINNNIVNFNPNYLNELGHSKKKNNGENHTLNKNGNKKSQRPSTSFSLNKSKIKTKNKISNKIVTNSNGNKSPPKNNNKENIQPHANTNTNNNTKNAVINLSSFLNQKILDSIQEKTILTKKKKYNKIPNVQLNKSKRTDNLQNNPTERNKKCIPELKYIDNNQKTQGRVKENSHFIHTKELDIELSKTENNKISDCGISKDKETNSNSTINNNIISTEPNKNNVNPIKSNRQNKKKNFLFSNNLIAAATLRKNLDNKKKHFKFISMKLSDLSMNTTDKRYNKSGIKKLNLYNTKNYNDKIEYLRNKNEGKNTEFLGCNEKNQHVNNINKGDMNSNKNITHKSSNRSISKNKINNNK